MATVLKIIERAFSKAGIKPAETPLSAAEIEDGIDALNDMLSAWNATGLLEGVDLAANPGDAFEAPRESLWMIKANLALTLAGEYAINPSQMMLEDARNSMSSWIKSSVQLRQLNFPGTLPRGSGNQWQEDTGWYRDFFPEDEKENF